MSLNNLIQLLVLCVHSLTYPFFKVVNKGQLLPCRSILGRCIPFRPSDSLPCCSSGFPDDNFMYPPCSIHSGHVGLLTYCSFPKGGQLSYKGTLPFSLCPRPPPRRRQSTVCAQCGTTVRPRKSTSTHCRLHFAFIHLAHVLLRELCATTHNLRILLGKTCTSSTNILDE